jgi:hypothetical protein
MNAKQMLFDYASKNNDRKVYTDEQFLGKAMTEGVRLADTEHGDIVVANIKREGKTIIVTETIKTDTPEGKKITATEIFRINI